VDDDLYSQPLGHSGTPTSSSVPTPASVHLGDKLLAGDEVSGWTAAISPLLGLAVSAVISFSGGSWTRRNGRLGCLLRRQLTRGLVGLQGACTPRVAVSLGLGIDHYADLPLQAAEAPRPPPTPDHRLVRGTRTHDRASVVRTQQCGRQRTFDPR
jgi:hypothetical protein